MLPSTHISGIALHCIGGFVVVVVVVVLLLLQLLFVCLIDRAFVPFLLFPFFCTCSFYHVQHGVWSSERKRTMVLESTVRYVLAYCSLEECGIQCVEGDGGNSVEQDQKRRDNLMIMPLSWRTRSRSKLSCVRVWGILVGFLHISLGRLEGTYM